MPLEFESISHGNIAFGFFNIETDMILLNHYFHFAEDFCHSISSLAEKPLSDPHKTSWNIYIIEKGKDIGNLMGAIHGVDHGGFIGEVYKLFPFPAKREDFKQKADGFKKRTLVEDVIQKYAKKAKIIINIDQKDDRIDIGEFAFNRSSFQKLVDYIWVGGYPRWKDDLRPDYVVSMKEKIDQSKNFLFNGLVLL